MLALRRVRCSFILLVIFSQSYPNQFTLNCLQGVFNSLWSSLNRYAVLVKIWAIDPCSTVVHKYHYEMTQAENC